MTTTTLDIGITTWNSALFIGPALEAIQRVCARWRPHVRVLDNASNDDTVAIARRHGADVQVRGCRQADALNHLASAGRAPFVLLMHADVILLDGDAFGRCLERLERGAALVSPEDIGCGPWSRPFGRGKPESSFLLFRRDALVALRRWTLGPRRFGVRWPRREVDFYGPHITHRLPDALARLGRRWEPLAVHASPAEPEAWYVPTWQPPVWRTDLGSLRYGLGNFYSIDGRVTHYHNWYERVLATGPIDPRATTGRPGEGFPLEYVRLATLRFLEDWRLGQVRLPIDLTVQPDPRAL
jgi:glycosyltransferase involved in cell wall biosynthesis